MGKVTGFMEYTRELPARRPPAERINDWFEIYQPFPRRQGPHAGRPLHGLRRALLPHRLPAEQHHSRLERPGLPRPLARSRAPAARHQQLSGIHRPHLPGARAKPPACSASTSRRSPSSRSRRPSSTTPSRRAGSCPSRPRSAPASAWRWSAPVPPAWPPRSNWRAPGTRSRSSKRTTASAACCATAFPISRWRSTSSTAAWSRCAPKACEFSTNAHVGANVPVEDLRREFDAILLAGGAEQPRDLPRARPRAEGHPLRHGVSAAAEPPQRRRRRCRESRSWPPASAW